MEHNHTQFAAAAAPILAASAVTFLRCQSPMVLDPEPIQQILALKGEADGEAMVCRVLEDIAMRLDVLQAARIAHSFDQIAKPSRRIIRVSAQIGLTDVTQSASHVALAAAQKDGVALSATLARLERAFDVAVSEVWRYRDYS